MRLPRLAARSAVALIAVLAWGARSAGAAAPETRAVAPGMDNTVTLTVRTPGGATLRSTTAVVFAGQAGRSYLLASAEALAPERGGQQGVRVEVVAGGRAAPARLVARGGDGLDVAVLEVGLVLPAAPLASDQAPGVGDPLIVIGAPFGKEHAASTGSVSQVLLEPAENAAAPPRARALAIAAAAAAGFRRSGGGVFDAASGALLGLVVGDSAPVELVPRNRLGEGAVPRGGWVVPASRLRRFLAERGLATLAGPPAAAGPESADAGVAPAAFQL